MSKTSFNKEQSMSIIYKKKRPRSIFFKEWPKSIPNKGPLGSIIHKERLRSISYKGLRHLENISRYK